MKLDSKYFDSIRIAQREARLNRKGPGCEWKGCRSEGLYRAPKGRGHEGEFYLFCMDHVRQYNARYNYFDGMSASEVEEFRKDAITGHRPTWKMGAPGSLPGGGRMGRLHAADAIGPGVRDAHRFFDREISGQGGSASPGRDRQLRPLEKKSLDTLSLSGRPTRVEIKARFKELVKRHHPDVNGGDPRSEDRLRDIIQAYNYLKQAGLV